MTGTLHAALWFVLFWSLVPLGCSALAGLIIALLQAATQVQEQCIGYLAKFLALVVVLAVAGPVCFNELVDLLVGVLQGLQSVQVQ